MRTTYNRFAVVFACARLAKVEIALGRKQGPESTIPHQKRPKAFAFGLF